MSVSELARTVEALLFLSADPVNETELAEACECAPEEITEALEELGKAYAPGERGLQLRELAGGWTFATAPEAEPAARRLLAKPRTPPLSPAQAETLAIVAYLQPVSRPEISRIRGVSADSAASTLLERGLIEESGRSPFGAVLYRTTSLFLKLFGMASLDDLPDVTEWDPTPEEEADLRERLLRAGEARAGSAPATTLEGEAAEVAGEAEAPADAEQPSIARSVAQGDTERATDAPEPEPEPDPDPDPPAS